MDNLIEPNWHPIAVHFVIAFLLTSPVLLLIASFAPDGARWRTSVQAAGDWMLALGVLFALIAVAAGLQAYYTVAHDGPSHAAMTDHRNFAFATVAVFAVFAAWRYATRSHAPAKLFAVLFLAAAVLLGTTGWKGGRLVYQHGLGVESLPAAEGEGHQHADGQSHDAGAEEPAAAEPHDHGDHEHEEAASDESASGAPAQPTESRAETAAPTNYADLGPTEIVDAFGRALKEKDEAAVRALLDPDVIVAEGGGAERSLEEYAGRHMPADMAFTAAVDFTLKDRSVIEKGDMATVISESQIHGNYNGQTVHSRMMETLILVNSADRWRIKHIHWSSAPITGEHEH